MSKIKEMLRKDFPEPMTLFADPRRTQFFPLIAPYHLPEETIEELIQELVALDDGKVEEYLADLAFVLGKVIPQS